MAKFYLLLFFICTFQSTKAESDLELEVMGQLNMLEDRVYFPINLYLSQLATNFESLATNFTNYQNEAKSVIDSYSQSIADNVNEVLDAFKESEIDMTTCEENLEENLNQIIKTGKDNVIDVILEGVNKGQNIITDAKNVYMVVQNKTVEIRLIVQNCMQLLDDVDCLVGALSKILVMQHTISTVITTTGVQHETQMSLLEDEVVADLEKVVVVVFGKFVEILDGFVMCAAQQELL